MLKCLLFRWQKNHGVLVIKKEKISFYLHVSGIEVDILLSLFNLKYVTFVLLFQVNVTVLPKKKKKTNNDN